MPGAPPPTPLSDLIERARKGASYPILAARAEDEETGTRASMAYLFRIVNGTVRSIPDDEHLAAIAAAINMPTNIVWLAALVQWMPRGTASITAGLQQILESEIEQHRQEQAAHAARSADDEDARLAAERAAMRIEALESIAEAHRLTVERARRDIA